MQDNESIRNLYAIASFACLLDSNDKGVRNALSGYADRYYRYIYGVWPPSNAEVAKIIEDAAASDPSIALTDADKMKLMGADTDGPLVIARKYISRELPRADQDTRDNVIRFIANVLLPLTGEDEPEYLKQIKSELNYDTSYNDLAFDLKRMPVENWSGFDDGDIFIILSYMLSVEDGIDESERESIANVYKAAYEKQTFQVRRRDMLDRLIAMRDASDFTEEQQVEHAAEMLKSRSLKSARLILAQLTDVAKADGKVSDEEAEFISKIVVKAGLSMDKDYMLAIVMNEAKQLHQSFESYSDKRSYCFDYACLTMFYDDFMARRSMWAQLVEYNYYRNRGEQTDKNQMPDGYADYLDEKVQPYIYDLSKHLVRQHVPLGVMSGSKPWFFLCWLSEIAEYSDDLRMHELSKMMYIIEQGKKWNGLFMGTDATINDLQPYIEYASAGLPIPKFDIKARVNTQGAASKEQAGGTTSASSEAKSESTTKKVAKWIIYFIIFYALMKACA